MALLSLALLLKFGSQVGDLTLQGECKRRLQRLVQVVVEWIREVLVLGAEYFKLAKLSKLQSLFKACQLFDALKFRVENVVQGSEQRICLRVYLGLSEFILWVHLVCFCITVHINMDQKFAE